MNQKLDNAVFNCLAAGLSVIPIDHSTKRPYARLLPSVADPQTGEQKPSWKPFQERQPTTEEAEAWLAGGIRALAVVCGQASGGLEILDFDVDGFYEKWIDEVGELVNHHQLTIQRTGGGGYQVLYRAPNRRGNQKLAWAKNDAETTGREIAIETRGEGGYAVIAPSLHPSGNFYAWLSGDASNIPTIPEAVADVLHQAAQRLCQMPYTQQDLAAHAKAASAAHANRVGDADGVIQKFNAATPIRETLHRLGYTDAGRGRLSRPGQPTSAGVAVLDTENVCFPWSSNDPLHRSNGDGKPKPVDPFEAVAQYEYGGDYQAAYIAAKKQMGLWTETPSRQKVDPLTGEITDWRPPTFVTVEETDNEYPTEDEEAAHPLDVTPVRGVALGWPDEYADLMTTLTGSPREFNQLAGLVTAAAAIQRRACLRMAFGDIYPNIYGCIIAPSSVYHKSAACSKPRSLLQRAMLDRLLLSELMTSEGLLKQLQGQSAGLILRDEIGTLFAAHNTRYLAQLKPDLTALYDCYPYSRALSQGDVKVEKPYLNILGATTPTRFFEGVSHVDWQDGFLARWLFVLPESDPNFDAMTGVFTHEHDAQLGRLAAKLVDIDRQRDTDFTLVGDAFNRWDAWQRHCARDAYYYGDDATAAIVTRYAAYALKFAIVLAAVNDSWGSITGETMQTAIGLADSYKAAAYRLLTEKRNYGVSGAKLQKVFALIKALPGKGKAATTGNVLRFSNMTKSQLAPCLDKLVEIGAIVEEPAGRGVRYIAVTGELPIKSWR